jgi:hypothetical protein
MFTKQIVNKYCHYKVKNATIQYGPKDVGGGANLSFPICRPEESNEMITDKLYKA